MAVDEYRPRFKIALQLGLFSRVSFNQAVDIRFADPEHGGDFRNAHSLGGNIRKARSVSNPRLSNFSNRLCERCESFLGAGHYSNGESLNLEGSHVARKVHGIRLTNYTVDEPGWNCDILLAF
jgi:hypothetical protein